MTIAVGAQLALLPPESACTEDPGELGDGYCDDGQSQMHNTALCDYDGGDCCKETCVSEAWNCPRAKMYCRDPRVLLSTCSAFVSFSIECNAFFNVMHIAMCAGDFWLACKTA